MTSTAAQMAVLIRTGSVADYGFVLGTWLPDFFHTSGGRLVKSTYFPAHRLVAEGCLTRGGVLLATDPEEPSVYYGWLCSEGPTLHYAWVKQAFRRLGIGRQLLQAATAEHRITEYSHRNNGLQWALRQIPGLSYNPYRAYGPVPPATPTQERPYG